jgi:hypothetical protein
LGVDTGATGPL